MNTLYCTKNQFNVGGVGGVCVCVGGGAQIVLYYPSGQHVSVHVHRTVAGFKKFCTLYSITSLPCSPGSVSTSFAAAMSKNIFSAFS
jgi:hypothetical protein